MKNRACKLSSWATGSLGSAIEELSPWALSIVLFGSMIIWSICLWCTFNWWNKLYSVGNASTQPLHHLGSRSRRCTAVHERDLPAITHRLASFFSDFFFSSKMWNVTWNALIDVYRNVHHGHLQSDKIQHLPQFPRKFPFNHSRNPEPGHWHTKYPFNWCQESDWNSNKSWFQESANELKDRSDGKNSSEGLNP